MHFVRLRLAAGKTEAVYTQMLEAVTDACTALDFNSDPTTVVTDFEMAAMHAVTAVFGQQVHVHGCFFHLCQSTWRHVQDMGLTALYNTDDVAKHFVGMLDGLALLPLADVQAAGWHIFAPTPPSTSTTSSTTLTPRTCTSQDDTASFSLPPSTPSRPYHQPGSDDSRPCSPQKCGTSTSPPSLGRTGRTTCASPGTRHSSD